MANYAASSNLRARLTRYAVKARPADEFTDELWIRSQIAREAADRLELTLRWRVTVIPVDRRARHFILIGRIDAVTRRAALIFGKHTAVVAVEPASPRGDESFDGRLTDIGEVP